MDNTFRKFYDLICLIFSLSIKFRNYSYAKLYFRYFPWNFKRRYYHLCGIWSKFFEINDFVTRLLYWSLAIIKQLCSLRISSELNILRYSSFFSITTCKMRLTHRKNSYRFFQKKFYVSFFRMPFFEFEQNLIAPLNYLQVKNF